MPDPIRLQLSRRKGFDLQKHSRAVNGLPAVNCTRPGKWGNQFRIGYAEKCLPYEDRPVLVVDAAHAVFLHRQWLIYFLNNEFPGCAETRRCLQDLRGKNLACSCKLWTPCHTDTLLELANR